MFRGKDFSRTVVLCGSCAVLLLFCVSMVIETQTGRPVTDAGSRRGEAPESRNVTQPTARRVETPVDSGARVLPPVAAPAGRGAAAADGERRRSDIRLAGGERRLPGGRRRRPDTFKPSLETGVCEGSRWPAGETPLYIVTPTYRRAEQLPELTRMGQTLLHVTSLVWIVAEDAPSPTQAVLEYLNRSGVCHVYLRAEMPTDLRAKISNYMALPRGDTNRNAGLAWIRAHARRGGVMYFADDDNTYDLRLFDELRRTRGVGMLPVGLVTALQLSAPVVEGGRVTGFYDGWLGGRKFPIDMACFAVSVDLLIKTKVEMTMNVGWEETKFIEDLGVEPHDIEPLADNCTKILVWHTRTEKNSPAEEPPARYNVEGTNLAVLLPQLWKGN